MSWPIAFTLIACSALLVDAQNAPACHSVSGDQITGRDLAIAIPSLSLIPPDLKLGYSPAPGAMRVFRAAQLQQLAKRYDIDSKISEPVCFAWSLRPLSKPEIIDAILKTLAGYHAEIEVTDESHALVPQGELTFPIQGLSAETTKPAIWNGYITYAGIRKFCTWAQVRITVHEEQIVAARSIAGGEVVDSSALKRISYAGPLPRSPFPQNENQVIGKCARWSISAGTVLTESMLSLPMDIEKDQLVTVHVSCGAAHIETQGIAADAGYVGNVIRVRNPKTGRIFRARIDDRGVVTVVAGGVVGLVVEDKKS